MGRHQKSPYEDTMMLDASERKHLEASHNFNASTFRRKLDFFDTCIDNEEIMEVGRINDANGKHRTGKKKTGSDNMRRLNESTVDFLIEEEDVVENQKNISQPPSIPQHF